MAAAWQQPAGSLPWSGPEQTSQCPALQERNNMKGLRTAGKIQKPTLHHQRLQGKPVSLSFPWESTGGGDDHTCTNCLRGTNPEPSTVVPGLLRIFSHSPAASSGELSSLPLCWAAPTAGTGKGRAPTFLNPLHLAFDSTHHGIRAQGIDVCPCQLSWALF